MYIQAYKYMYMTSRHIFPLHSGRAVARPVHLRRRAREPGGQLPRGRHGGARRVCLVWRRRPLLLRHPAPAQVPPRPRAGAYCVLNPAIQKIASRVNRNPNPELNPLHLIKPHTGGGAQEDAHAGAPLTCVHRNPKS